MQYLLRYDQSLVRQIAFAFTNQNWWNVKLSKNLRSVKKVSEGLLISISLSFFDWEWAISIDILLINILCTLSGNILIYKKLRKFNLFFIIQFQGLCCDGDPETFQLHFNLAIAQLDWRMRPWLRIWELTLVDVIDWFYDRRWLLIDVNFLRTSINNITNTSYLLFLHVDGFTTIFHRLFTIHIG